MDIFWTTLLIPLAIILLLGWRSKTGHGLPRRGGRDPLMGAPRLGDTSMKNRKATMTLPVGQTSQSAARQAMPAPLSEGPAAAPDSPSASYDPAAVAAAIQREVQMLIAQGRWIDAIKLVREKSGMGLKEAKDWVAANRK